MNNSSYLYEDYIIPPRRDAVRFSEAKHFKEWLTLDALKATDATSPFTKGKGEERKKFYKGENLNAVLVQCEYDSSHDFLTFHWLTPATMKAHGSDYICKEADPNGNLKLNPSEAYEMQLRIIDFMKWLKETRPDNLQGQPITWKELKDVLYSAYIQVHCTDPSYWWQGDAWYGTQLDCAIYPCNIAPKQWNKVHDPVNALCKHLRNLMQQIDFFANPMTSMAQKELKRLNLI